MMYFFFETEATQKAFPVAYFNYQDCNLAFAWSKIAMLKFSMYVPNRAPVISVCPDTKTKNLMKIC